MVQGSTVDRQNKIDGPPGGYMDDGQNDTINHVQQSEQGNNNTTTNNQQPTINNQQSTTNNNQKNQSKQHYYNMQQLENKSIRENEMKFQTTLSMITMTTRVQNTGVITCKRRQKERIEYVLRTSMA